jgi:hypothetical protein
MKQMGTLLASTASLALRPDKKRPGCFHITGHKVVCSQEEQGEAPTGFWEEKAGAKLGN